MSFVAVVFCVCLGEVGGGGGGKQARGWDNKKEFYIVCSPITFQCNLNPASTTLSGINFCILKPSFKHFTVCISWFHFA